MRKIWGVSIIGFLLLCGIGYFLGKQTADPQVLIENMKQAVSNNDSELLQTYMILDEKTNVTQDQAKRILDSLKKNPTFLERNETTPETRSSFTLKKTGTAWFFFDSYKMQVTPTYAYTRALKEIVLTTSESGVKISEDTKENTNDQKAYIIGPLFPGEHTIYAKMPTIFGEVEKNVTFTSQLGINTTFPVHIETKQIHIYTNSQNATLYYQGKPIAEPFSKSYLDYSLTLKNVPVKPLEFTVKAKTPFGDIESKALLSNKETTLELPIQIGKAPQVRKSLKTLFQEYNKAWVTYAQSKTSVTPLKKYLAPHSKAEESYTNEMTAFLQSPPKYQEVFTGKLQAVAIDFGSLTIVDGKTATVKVKETFFDQWRNNSTGEVKNNGKDELYWIYQLQLVNGEWKIAEYWEIPAWSWGDKISDVEEINM